jgi:hypothetical protein
MELVLTVLYLMFTAGVLGGTSTKVFMFSCVTMLGFMFLR